MDIAELCQFSKQVWIEFGEDSNHILLDFFLFPFPHIQKLHEEGESHGEVEVLLVNMIMQSVGDEQKSDHQQK